MEDLKKKKKLEISLLARLFKLNPHWHVADPML